MIIGCLGFLQWVGAKQTVPPNITASHHEILRLTAAHLLPKFLFSSISNILLSIPTSSDMELRIHKAMFFQWLLSSSILLIHPGVPIPS